VLRAPIRGTGLGIANWAAVQGKKSVDMEADRTKNISSKDLAEMMPGLNRDGQLATLMRFTKERDMDKLLDNPDQYLNGEWEKSFEARGLGKEHSDLEKSLGTNTRTYELHKDGKTKEAEKAQQEFIAGFSPSDFSKLQANAIFGRKMASDIQKLVARGIAINNPGDFGRVLMGAKGENRDRVVGSFKEVADELFPTQLSKDLNKAIEHTLGAKKLTGFVAGETQQPTTAPTPTPPPTPPPPPKP